MKLEKYPGPGCIGESLHFKTASGKSLWFEIRNGEVEVAVETNDGGHSFFLTQEEWAEVVEAMRGESASKKEDAP